jgi:AraC family transcriptional regulator, transcriptional activator FtrA
MKIMPKHQSATARPKNRLIALAAYDGVNAFELGMALEIFGLPNMGPDWYRVVVCAERPGRCLWAGGGLNVVADIGLTALARAGTIVVPGWRDVNAAAPKRLLAALRRAHERGARIVSICSGVFLLAAAGLLDGRRVTAHWVEAPILARRYPRLLVDSDVLYVDDGDIMSSAGRAAGLDLCLHIVRRDYGMEVANLVARRLVIAPHREGGQAQFIPRPVQTTGDPLKDVFAWVQRNIERDLTIANLAAKARMSRRTFIRRFEAATGVSPGEWVVGARIAEARRLLETTELSIEQVATAVGFGSADTLRHHFRTQLDTSPARYRSVFQGARGMRHSEAYG